MPMFWTLRDGKVQKLEMYQGTERALESVGPSGACRARVDGRKRPGCGEVGCEHDHLLAETRQCSQATATCVGFGRPRSSTDPVGCANSIAFTQPRCIRESVRRVGHVAELER